jgi:hypothetical protein
LLIWYCFVTTLVFFCSKIFRAYRSEECRSTFHEIPDILTNRCLAIQRHIRPVSYHLPKSIVKTANSAVYIMDAERAPPAHRSNIMSTRAQRRAAARANAKKSPGPVTPAPQATSAAIAASYSLVNAGRLASSVCLSNENRSQFIEMYESLLSEHRPVTPTEHLILEEMAVARWRQQRAWLMETDLLENQMDKMTSDIEKEYVSIHEATRITLAFRELAEKSPALQLLQRYESRLSRQIERCRKQLLSFRASRADSPIKTPELQNVPIEPSPGNEHFPAALQPNESASPTAQPVPAADRPRPTAVTPPQSAPKLAGFHPRPQPDDPATSPAAQGILPRAA